MGRVFQMLPLDLYCSVRCLGRVSRESLPEFDLLFARALYELRRLLGCLSTCSSSRIVTQDIRPSILMLQCMVVFGRFRGAHSALVAAHWRYLDDLCRLSSLACVRSELVHLMQVLVSSGFEGLINSLIDVHDEAWVVFFGKLGACPTCLSFSGRRLRIPGTMVFTFFYLLAMMSGFLLCRSLLLLRFCGGLSAAAH